MIDILMRELLDMPEQQIAHIGAEPLRGQGRIVLADHGKAKACKHHQPALEQAQPEHDMKIAADHASLIIYAMMVGRISSSTASISLQKGPSVHCTR